MKEEITEPILNDIEPVNLGEGETKEKEVQKEEDSEEDGVIVSYVKNDRHFEIKDDAIYVTLDKPMENMAKELIKVVKVREPRLMDIRRVNKGSYINDEEGTLALTLLLTGLEESFFNKLKIPDSDRIWCATKYFLLERPATKILQKIR